MKYHCTIGLKSALNKEKYFEQVKSEVLKNLDSKLDIVIFTRDYDSGSCTINVLPDKKNY